MKKNRAKEAGAIREDQDSGDSDEANSSVAEEEGDVDDEVDDLFRTTGAKTKSGRKGLLKSGELDIDRVRDANQAEATSVRIFLTVKTTNGLKADPRLSCFPGSHR